MCKWKKSKLGDHCTNRDTITVNGKKISFTVSKMCYIVMNKALGYVCTASDELSRSTVFDLLKKRDRAAGLFYIGRLDKDTSGLLVLTNDGQFAQRIIHPSSKVRKEYEVKLDKVLSEQDKRILEKGIQLGSIKLRPCSIAHKRNLRYRVCLYEGRKRQIRRMFEQRGYSVELLIRQKIGSLGLLGLKEGEYRKVEREYLEKRIFGSKDENC